MKKFTPTMSLALLSAFCFLLSAFSAPIWTNAPPPGPGPFTNSNTNVVSMVWIGSNDVVRWNQTSNEPPARIAADAALSNAVAGIAGGSSSDAVARASAALALAQNVRTSNAIPTTAAQVGADASGAAATASAGVYAVLSPLVATAQATGATAYAVAVLASNLAANSTAGGITNATSLLSSFTLSNVAGVVTLNNAPNYHHAYWTGAGNSGDVWQSTTGAGVGALVSPLSLGLAPTNNATLHNTTMWGNWYRGAQRVIFGVPYGLVAYSWAAAYYGVTNSAGQQDIAWQFTADDVNFSEYRLLGNYSNLVTKITSVSNTAAYALAPGNVGIFNYCWTTNTTQIIPLIGQSVTEPEAWPTGSNTVWLVYHSGKTHESDIGCSRLAEMDYNGNIISDRQVASNATWCVNNEEIIQTSAGTLLFFHTMMDVPAMTNDSKIYVMRSTDRGATWGTDTLIPYGGGTCTTTGRGIVYGNTIIKPIAFSSLTNSAIVSAYVVKSTDDGVTWGSPIPIALASGDTTALVEPCLAFNGGSNLICALRVYTNSMQCWTTTSADLGATWSTPKYAFDISGKTAITRLSNGYLVISYRGYGCSYQVSRDGGNTWAVNDSGTMDTDMNWQDYSTGFEISSNVLVTVYSANMATNSDIMRLKIGGISGNSRLGDLWGTATRACGNKDGVPFGSVALLNSIAQASYATNAGAAITAATATNLLNAGSAAFAGSNQFVRSATINGATSNVDTNGNVNLGTISAGGLTNGATAQLTLTNSTLVAARVDDGSALSNQWRAAVPYFYNAGGSRADSWNGTTEGYNFQISTNTSLYGFTPFFNNSATAVVSITSGGFGGGVSSNIAFAVQLYSKVSHTYSASVTGEVFCTGNYLDFVTTFPPIAVPTNGPYTIIITRYPGLTPSGTNAYNSIYWYVTAAEVRSK